MQIKKKKTWTKLTGSMTFIKEIKKCAECIVELYKHAGIFKNTREVQRSTSRRRVLLALRELRAYVDI